VKKHPLAFLFLLMTWSGFANIALPVMPPRPAGDLLPAERAYDLLRIEREDLFLNLLGETGAFSTARYAVRNIGGEALAADLLFLTPEMEEVTVTANGTPLAPVPVTLRPGELPWEPDEDTADLWPEEVRAYRFRVVFAGGAVTEILVRFRLPAGYDNRDSRNGLSPAAAGHPTNWTGNSGQTLWYRYYLASARSFKGGIGTLSVSVLAPRNAELTANIVLERGEEIEGGVVYRGGFQGIPASFVEAKVRYPVNVNLFGATIGAGLVTDYDGYLEFMAQVLLDVYFSNHQFSAGIELNPFGRGLKLPLLYTYIPGEPSAYVNFIGDLRFTAGVLFDLSPEALTGFRVAVGFRMTIMILEITYDFYPFDPDAGYLGRMTFLYKIAF